MNILEALKNYIRSHGGSSRANNILEAVKDLDSIPQGSGGGGMIVTIDFDGSTGTADKTYDEIIAAVKVGTAIMFKGLINGELFMYIPFGGAFDMGAGLIISAKFEDVAITCESGTTWTMLG